MKIDARMRRRARILAMQALYSMDVGDASPQAALEAAQGLDRDMHEGMDESAIAYGEALVSEVNSQRSRIDDLIAAASTQWRVDRMSRLDVQILRVASAELLANREDVPTPVVIDEAVELAREFGGDSSPGFVNGVLDSIARTLDAGNLKVEPRP